MLWVYHHGSAVIPRTDRNHKKHLCPFHSGLRVIHYTFRWHNAQLYCGVLSLWCGICANSPRLPTQTFWWDVLFFLLIVWARCHLNARLLFSRSPPDAADRAFSLLSGRSHFKLSRCNLATHVERDLLCHASINAIAHLQMQTMRTNLTLTGWYT